LRNWKGIQIFQFAMHVDAHSFWRVSRMSCGRPSRVRSALKKVAMKAGEKRNCRWKTEVL
jgi:hypothetical protein